MNSFVAHNNEYIRNDTLNREMDIHKKKTYESINKTGGTWDNLYKPGHLHGEWLDSQSEIKDAVDIGSGTGWFVNYLKSYKQFDNVCGIEPSQSAIDIAKKINPDNNVVYLCGFAESELRKIKLSRPTLFTTSIVLSHLEDATVINILTEMDKIAPKGSVFIFNENYGASFNMNLWYSRTKEWWENKLPNWDISYDERDRSDLIYYKQGILGCKVR